MNSEFQIIRWGIPGWIALLTFASFKISLFGFDIKALLNTFGVEDKSLAMLVTGIAAFFVALGVPIGYLLYQIYFMVKWRFGNRSAYEAIAGIKDLEKIRTNNIRMDWDAIENYFNHLMTVVVAQKNIGYEDLKRRNESYSNRTSRTHGLGASFIGMVLGFGTFFLLDVVGCSLKVSLYYDTLLMIIFIISGWAVWSNYCAMNVGTYRQLNKIMLDILNAPPRKND